MKNLKRLLYVFASMSFVIGMTNFIFNGILDKIAFDLGVSIAEAGLLITSASLGSAFGAPLVVLVFAKANRKHLMLGLLIISALTMAIIGYVQDYNTLLIIRFFSGLSINSYGILSFASVISLSDPKRQGRSLAFLITGTTLSLIVGIPLTRILVDVISWRTIFYAFALVTLVISVLFFYMLPKPKDHYERLALKEEFKYLKNGRILSIYLFTILMFIGYGVILTYSTPFLIERFTFLEKWMSLILVALGFATFFGNNVGGHLTDKIGYAKAMWLGSVLQTASVAFLILFASNGILNVSFVVLIYFSAWLTGLQMNIGIIQLSHHDANFVLSINGSGIQLGVTIGSYLGSLIIVSFGIAYIPYLALASALSILILQSIVISQK